MEPLGFSGANSRAYGVIALARALILAEIPRADVALASYESHADDRITERPNGFEVGLKILPDIAQAPSACTLPAASFEARPIPMRRAMMTF